MKFPVRMVGRHGAMHAYSVSEVAHLQTLGWSVEEPPVVPVINGADVPIEKPAALVELDAIDAAIGAIADKVTKRKPGRPRKGE